MLEQKKIEARIGVSFHDANHVLTAFTHRSYLNEHRNATQDHNERYEFLGDAVLELVATDHLFRTYSDKPEGDLTAIRSAVVNTQSLAEATRKLEVEDYILMSKGEAKDTGRARQYLLANTFEAIVGAIYLDQGYQAAASFIARNLFAQIPTIIDKQLWKDAKSRFQEVAQSKENVTPSYTTLRSTGPDHARVFVVGVFLADRKVAEGKGHSKQEAEQEAAEKALEVLGW